MQPTSAIPEEYYLEDYLYDNYYDQDYDYSGPKPGKYLKIHPEKSLYHTLKCFMKQKCQIQMGMAQCIQLF